MNKFVVFAALIAVALASSSSSSSVPAPSSSSAVPAPSSSSAAPVVSSSSVPVVSSSSSSSVAPVEPSSSSSSVAPVEPSSSSSEIPVLSSSSSAGPETKTFVPTIDCAVHFNATLFIGNTSEFWGYIDQSSPKNTVMKMVMGDEYNLFRCDLADDKGNCYAQNVTEEYPECAGVYLPYDEVIAGFDSILPSVEYLYPDYPKDFACPDGSEGCKLYCEAEGGCIIADTKGRIVGKYVEKTGMSIMNITYFDDEFDASVFAIKDCNGTDLSVPTNPCGAGSKSSSNGASFVQVAYAVLLAALLVALF